MEVLLDQGKGRADSWAFLSEGGRLELGAQLVPNIEQPEELVVVWRAPVRVEGLRRILSRAEETLRGRGESIRGRLTGYGPTKEFLHLARFIAHKERDDFQAYRAELETPEEAVVIWANVAHGDNRDLATASDNIGMSVPLRSLAGWSSALIAYAVSSTKDMNSDQATDWLKAVVAQLLAQPEAPSA
jgi:hypothetical protein